eukprot:m.307876 g.307876  ORF g.307876 m.307876 type:complete len:450 (+) comp16466_c1_seq13:2358-3707(+)
MINIQDFLQYNPSKLFNMADKGLQYLSAAEKAAKIIPGLANVTPKPLNSIGIVGAGLMGGGIGMSCADAGMTVRILDVSQEGLEKGLATIKKNYARSVKRGSTTQAKVEASLNRFHPTLSYDSFKDVDIVVEAVFENMNIKKKIFAELDRVCRPGAILASNTSGLDIDVIANVTKRPQDVIGCHFFSPANVMRLLENVRGKATSDVTIATAMHFGEKIGKVPVLVGNCPGFVGNRMLGLYTSASMELLMLGATVQEVDKAAESFGMRMGPLRMTDLVGIDLFGRERARSGIADPKKYLTDFLFANGRYGMKVGKGLYQYDSDRKPFRDPIVDEAILDISRNLGKTRRFYTRQEIENMLFLGLINEGFKILEEGIAIRPSDIDVIYVYGYNFPKARGGPMLFADEMGLNNVLEGVKQLNLKPAKLLETCVSQGITVAQWAEANASKPSKL